MEQQPKFLAIINFKNMKKTFFILSLSIAMISCNAQNIITLESFTLNDLDNNNYIKDTSGILNPYVGTWRWTDTTTNSEFTVVFLIKTMYNPNNLLNYSEDTVMGSYKYIQNGNIIVDKLVFDINNISSPNYALILSNISSPFSELSLNLFDIVKGKSCEGDFELIDPVSLPNGQLTSNQARWKIWDKEHWKINGTNPLPQGFSIPTNVILTKIN